MSADRSAGTADDAYVPLRRGDLSYANTFTNPVRANIIRFLEYATGKPHLLRLVRKMERAGPIKGQGYWTRVLRIMGIDLLTPLAQIERIPTSGPLVVVANHPHGLVDGIVLAELVGRIRTDYKILTRSILTGIDASETYMIPVPFPHEDDALKKSLDMRKQAMAHLEAGGVIALFPSGVVATSETLFGPVVEAEWNLFTAKMIRRSGAAVLPVYFPGQNSRWYHIANKVSTTLRQGLLVHEVKHALNKPQAPIVGNVISSDEVGEWSDSPSCFVTWLRQTTLDLKDSKRRGVLVEPAGDQR